MQQNIYKGMQVCKYASKKLLFKHACLQVFKCLYVSMPVCKYRGMLECKYAFTHVCIYGQSK